MRQILKFCARYFSKNVTFCQIFLDFTLFHQFLASLLPNIVNIGYFAVIKVRRNSGELKKMQFFIAQSCHLRRVKTQGSTGRNCEEPRVMYSEVPNDPRVIHRGQIHQYKPFQRTFLPFRCPQESQRDHFLPQKALTGRKATEGPKAPW